MIDFIGLCVNFPIVDDSRCDDCLSCWSPVVVVVVESISISFFWVTRARTGLVVIVIGCIWPTVMRSRCTSKVCACSTVVIKNKATGSRAKTTCCCTEPTTWSIGIVTAESIVERWISIVVMSTLLTEIDLSIVSSWWWWRRWARGKHKIVVTSSQTTEDASFLRIIYLLIQEISKKNHRNIHVDWSYEDRLYYLQHPT